MAIVVEAGVVSCFRFRGWVGVGVLGSYARAAAAVGTVALSRLGD